MRLRHALARTGLVLLGAVGPVVAAALLLARSDSFQLQAAGKPGAGRTFTSVDFDEVCGRPVPPNPRPVRVDVAEVSQLLHGAWVGVRTVRYGTTHDANYAMVYDMKNRKTLVLEERGAGIRGNAFTTAFPQPAADAPRMTNFFCGAKGRERSPVGAGDEGYGPFRDDFVKVSNDADLGQFQGVIGVDLDGLTFDQAWVKLADNDWFMRPRPALLNAFLATNSLKPHLFRGTRVKGVRLDLVGENRGSPAKFKEGQPVAAVEGGLFEGVKMPTGRYLVALGERGGYTVACGGGLTVPTAQDGRDPLPPLTTFRYTKVVIGPLPPSGGATAAGSH